MPSVDKPSLTVVIPAAAAPDVFEDVLESVCSQDPAPAEVIVVDDAMDPRGRDIVADFGVRYPVRSVSNSGRGVSAARNAGAASANGDILVFIDTDVIVQPGAFAAIGQTLGARPEIDGVVGLQSARLRFTGFFSRWKNHWMRFTYRRLSGDVHLFYTSCAAIRRKVFTRSGGFDENYRLPSIEDTAFGGVLGRIGARIIPLPAFEVEHVKAYSFRSVLRTDCARSAALVKYVLRNMHGGHDSGTSRTSVPAGFMIGTACVALFWIFVFLGLLWNPVALTVAAVMLAATIGFNAAWLNYLLTEEGPTYFFRSVLFIPLDVTVVILGMLKGLIGFASGKRY